MSKIAAMAMFIVCGMWGGLNIYHAVSQQSGFSAVVGAVCVFVAGVSFAGMRRG